MTLPHAIGLGLLAFGAVAAQWHAGALALWSAALPGAVMVYGEGEHIDAAGVPLGCYPTLPPATPIDAALVE